MSTITATRTVAAACAVLILGGCGVASSGRTVPGASLSSTPAGSSAPTPTPSAAVTESNPPGDIPDNQAFVAYSSTTGGWSVKVPEGWARTATGSTVVFSDKLNSIRIEESMSAAVPTLASDNGVVVPGLKTSAPMFKLKAVAAFTRPGGSGTLITYLMDSPPDSVTNKVVRDAVERYSFWKAGRLVVISLIGPQTADNVDPWRKVTDSFGWSR